MKLNYDVSSLIVLSAQEENVQLREEVEGLHRKFDALKRFAAQKKIRLPAEFEQYQWFRTPRKNQDKIW